MGSGRAAERVATCVCVFVGGMFLYSGLVKVQQPYDFLSGVYSFGLFSRSVGVLVATMIPSCEIVIGLALIARTCERGALLLAAILCVAFVGVRSLASRDGHVISCYCFGETSGIGGHDGWRGLVLSATTLASVVFALWVRQKRSASDACETTPWRRSK
jgi:hypothetical protein